MCSKMYYNVSCAGSCTNHSLENKHPPHIDNTQQQQKNMWYAAKCVMSYMCCIEGTPPAITFTLRYLYSSHKQSTAGWRKRHIS